ncbi:MAG: ATP-binding cassette domain-containing protein, partial [bacterium]|nr:ATP-binding cassette domain-containing protein [bacterium]
MDNLENAIEIKNVSKDFRVFKDRPKTIKEQILNLCSNEYTPFHALKNVNLSIKKGESIALIGHNGCGKSTLLSIIAGILYPTSGTVKVNGRLSCLISLGAGFHPDFTGRENIYTNAAILGLSKKETEENLDS